MTMRPSAARVDVSATPDWASSTWNATSTRERENERGDFQVAPVPSGHHLARDERSKDC